MNLIHKYLAVSEAHTMLEILQFLVSIVFDLLLVRIMSVSID